MTEPRFTPGPWQSKHDYDVEGATTIIANVDGEIVEGVEHYTFDFICTCDDEFGERLPNAQANARLIRNAPALFDALVALVEERGPINPRWHEAQAVIAAVRGEQVSA